MAYISTVPEDQASADVEEMYAENLEAMGYLPNYVKIFSHRPEVMAAWGTLLRSIESNMDARHYELVTLVAARALDSSYCMLAHGSILCEQFYSPEQLARIATDYRTADLTPAEVAMMAFAEQVVRDPLASTQHDINTLRAHGFSDAKIFDITATAAARCFITKTNDALGVEPDENYLTLDKNLREALTVGRPISGQSG